MRIVCANIFCLNPRPRQALREVAAQGGDVTVLIEATPRFDRFVRGILPPRRMEGLTRSDGMPVAVHAEPALQVEPLQTEGDGWVECQVAGLTLLVVHAVSPYLPWRLRRRRRQLEALGDRLASIAPEEPAIAVGDFNTSHAGRAWKRFDAAARDWRRLLPGPEGASGTWPLGSVWAPVALDHALAPPHLAGVNGDDDHSARLRTFPIPGSDHLGLTVDLPRGTVPLPQAAGEAV